MITHSTENNFHSIQLRFTDFRGDHSRIHEKQDFFKGRLFRIETWGTLESQFFSSLFLHVTFHNRLNKFNININIFKGKNIGLIHEEIAILDMNIDLVGNQPYTDAVSIMGVFNQVLHFRELLSFLLGFFLKNLGKIG